MPCSDGTIGTGHFKLYFYTGNGILRKEYLPNYLQKEKKMRSLKQGYVGILFFAVFWCGVLPSALADDYSGVYEIAAPSVCDVYVDGRSNGSCFVVDARGFVITNFHVIEKGLSDNANFSIGFKNKKGERRYDVESAMHIHHDLALLKILPKNGEYFTPLIIADSRMVRSAEPVFALGYPMGFPDNTVAVTKGIISYLYSVPENPNEPLELYNYFWVDALVSPGNSGGPMLNKKGEVVAITTMMSLIAPSSFNVYGPGVGMPSEVLVGALKKLANAGTTIRRGYLDMTLGTDPEHWAYFLTPQHSTRVRVLKSSLAEVMSNDRITTINGHPMSIAEDVSRYIQFQEEGNTVSLCVMRGVTEHCFNVTVGAIEEENIFK